MRRSRAETADQFAAIAPHYDALMDSVPYGLWAGYVTRLTSLAGRPIRPGARILDLATGTGSIALEFAAAGCRVTGLDCSEPMLAEARRKAAARALDIEFLCGDLCDFDLPSAFHHALCLYDSFNYLLDPADLKQAFANTKAALGPGGLLIFDVNTVHALEAELFTQKSRSGAPVQYRWKSKYNPETGISRIKMSFRVRATGEKMSVIHHQRAYSDPDIRGFLAGAGFAAVTSYEAYDVIPPDARSDRVFYVAAAPG